jgi:hypothetical protein
MTDTTHRRLEGGVMMGFIQFMSRQQVVEKYSIPPELESEIFSVLRPAHGSGVNARYLESLVDKQLTRHFEQKDRLRMKDAWSYANKETSMKETWADTVAEEEEVSMKPLERLLVDEDEAAQMLGVSKRMVFDLNKQGLLPARMVGSRKKYAVKNLREFAEGKVA